MNSRAKLSVAVLVAAFHIACSRSSDEEQIRAVIDAGEKAAESRDTSDAMDLVADDYRDRQGLDKEQLRSFLRAYFFTHPKIELLIRIPELKIETPTNARARIEVTMVGTQGSETSTGMAAESESLVVDFRKDGGKWKVARVERSARN